VSAGVGICRSVVCEWMCSVLLQTGKRDEYVFYTSIPVQDMASTKAASVSKRDGSRATPTLQCFLSAPPRPKPQRPLGRMLDGAKLRLYLQLKSRKERPSHSILRPSVIMTIPRIRKKLELGFPARISSALAFRHGECELPNMTAVRHHHILYLRWI
jgi:hypothetical protein